MITNAKTKQLRQVLWLGTIWLASVAALGAFAAIIRLAIAAAGLATGGTA